MNYREKLDAYRLKLLQEALQGKPKVFARINDRDHNMNLFPVKVTRSALLNDYFYVESRSQKVGFYLNALENIEINTTSLGKNVTLHFTASSFQTLK